jgi:outer membrane scaffolding protein for murein synthesis (MipA/OmpV family)
MMKTTTIFPYPILTLLLISPVSQADIGLGLGIKGSEYKGVDGIANIQLEYRGEKFNIADETLSYSLTENDQFRFDIIAKAEARGYESDFADELTGMDDRDASLDLGGKIATKTRFGELSLAATTDISNNHKGQEADLRFGPKPFQSHWNGKRELSVGALAGAKWQSDEVIDYYYGVKTNEVTNDRAAYTGKSAITPYVGVQADVNLTEHLSLKAQALYKDLPKEITDSPIVDSDQELQLQTTVTYWF